MQNVVLDKCFNHNMRLNCKCNLTPFYNNTHKMCNLEHDYKTFLNMYLKEMEVVESITKSETIVKKKVNYKQ